MQIRNRIFPYPVLNNFKDITCFKKSDYQLCYDEIEQTTDRLILKNTFIILNNKELISLLEQKKIRAVVIVECSSTLYRESFEVDFEKKNIEIILSNLKDNVVISSFIYALEDIENYRSEDFLEEYEDYSFNIEKYNFLAVDDGITMKIDYDESEDKKVASIFSIIKDTSNELNCMKIELLEKKIIIYLPEEQFNLYYSYRANDNFTNLFFAMLAIPALIHALDRIKLEGADFEEIEMSYSWFASIKKAYKKQYDKELTEDIFSDLDVVKLAQDLLNNGTIKAIEDVFVWDIKNRVEDTNNE